uniref:Uncharacterized protein n=1 Tax=viral metagenome TaxID=1070528 RepID=A0A6C0C8K8_9ZZZZ
MLLPPDNDSLNKNRRLALPPNIDAMEGLIRDQWKKVYKTDILNACQEKPHPTLHRECLKVAGILLCRYLTDRNVFGLRILEIMAGNCEASKVIQGEIKAKYESWKYTDIGDYAKGCEQMDAICAVEKYGKEYNTLLMISPPPGSIDYLHVHSSYGDYFACKKFIEMETGEQRYIIIIGELGGSDASQGMYLYMMKHPSLILEFRCTFLIAKDHQGGPVEKEVFVFSIWK